MKYDRLRYVIHLLLIAGSVLLLIFPALRNGYPLLYSDSATILYLVMLAIFQLTGQ
jgi:hypothetical protein